MDGAEDAQFARWLNIDELTLAEVDAGAGSFRDVGWLGGVCLIFSVV